MLMTCCSNPLVTKLKDSFPSALKRAMSRKSLMFDGKGGIVLEMKTPLHNAIAWGLLNVLLKKKMF